MPTSQLIERATAAATKSTAQQQIVCRGLKASRDHLDAALIFQRARKTDTKISLAIVDRTLKVRTELQLVSAHDFGNTLESHNLELCGHSVFADNQPFGRRNPN